MLLADPDGNVSILARVQGDIDLGADGVRRVAQVVTRLGTLPSITPQVIEGMFASDLAFLQDLYRRVNQEGTSQAAVTCPECHHEFTVEIGGGSPGGS